MQLESLKVWHWMVIGLLVGLGLGYWQVESGPNLDRGITKTIYQEEFERRLFETYLPKDTKPEDAKPVMHKILVHPPIDGKVWITGIMIDVPNMREQRDLAAQKKPIVAKPVGFRYPTEVPYKPRYYANLMDPKATTKPATPLDSIKPPAASVVDYLNKLKEQRNDLKASYSFAWWETKPAMMAIWTGGTFVLVGCVWPVLIQMLMGMGLTPRPKEKAYDLDRFKGEKATASAKAGPSTDEQQQLADLNAQLEAKLAGFANDEEDEELKAEHAAAEAKAEARVRALPSGPLEAVAGKPDDEPKEYTGEFYPVVKSHGDSHQPKK